MTPPKPARGSLRATNGRVQKQIDDLRRAPAKCSGQGRRCPERELGKPNDPVNGSSAAHRSWPVAGAPQLSPEEFVAGEMARIMFEVTLSRPGGLAPAMFGRIR